jgi:hypothetical protein
LAAISNIGAGPLNGAEKLTRNILPDKQNSHLRINFSCGELAHRKFRQINGPIIPKFKSMKVGPQSKSGASWPNDRAQNLAQEFYNWPRNFIIGPGIFDWPNRREAG